jgi:hypothetical protein
MTTPLAKSLKSPSLLPKEKKKSRNKMLIADKVSPTPLKEEKHQSIFPDTQKYHSIEQQQRVQKEIPYIFLDSKKRICSRGIERSKRRFRHGELNPGLLGPNRCGTTV